MDPSPTTGRVVVTILQTIAIFATVTRLWIRITRQKMWYEDAFVFAALLVNITGLVAWWIWTNSDTIPYSSDRVAAFWIIMSTSSTALWLSRLSIWVSIIRILPPRTKCHRIATVMACVFCAITVALITFKSRICVMDQSWIITGNPSCRTNGVVATFDVATDVFGDGMLVIFPFKILLTVRLPKVQKQLLYITLGTSFTTAIISVIRICFLKVHQNPLLDEMMAQIEAAVGMTVANALVLIFFAITHWPTDRPFEIDEYPSPGMAYDYAETDGTRTGPITSSIFDTLSLNARESEGTDNEMAPAIGDTPTKEKRLFSIKEYEPDVLTTPLEMKC